jgi:hypothetical protein
MIWLLEETWWLEISSDSRDWCLDVDCELKENVK